MERTLTSAVSILKRRLEDAGYWACEIGRMTRARRHWLLVSRPDCETLVLELHPGVTAEALVETVFQAVAARAG